MDELEYIVKDALLECTQGAAPQKFKPTYNQVFKTHGIYVATEKDIVPELHIPSFKICKINNQKCAPCPLKWEETYPTQIKGARSLIGKSTCKCSKGGTLRFLTSGQIPLTEELEQKYKKINQELDNYLPENQSVGEAGLVEGLVPVWGSGRDLVNSVQTGNGWGMAINAGFLVWDVVSVAAGALTLGAGTAAMQGIKTGVRTGIKSGAKIISKKALKALTERTAQAFSKQSVNKAVEKMSAALCQTVVRACFPKGTLIHTQDGLQPIEKIKIDDRVWSCNLKNHSRELKKVVSFDSLSAPVILKIQTETESLFTTPTHPFYVNGSFMDADSLQVGDLLFSSHTLPSKIIALYYIEQETQVYTFEVEDNHTYYIGIQGYLVHNTCYRKIFFKAHPQLKGKVWVHHAVEQRVLKDYPGLFTKEEMHALENLRGIPKEINSNLHLRILRRKWDEFYLKRPKATKEQLLRYAKHLDKKYGHLFAPPIK